MFKLHVLSIYKYALSNTLWYQRHFKTRNLDYGWSYDASTAAFTCLTDKFTLAWDIGTDNASAF